MGEERREVNEMKGLQQVASILVIVGAINIGLSALGFNVLNMILGSMSGLEQIVNILIGLSGVLALVNMNKK